MSKILLVARDVAPSNAFALLQPVLAASGCHVTSALGKGKALEAEAFGTAYDAVPFADVVVLGMSAPADNAAEEILVGHHAINQQVPVVLYADTFGAWSRTWFSDVIGRATQVWLPTDRGDEQKRAIQFLDPTTAQTSDVEALRNALCAENKVIVTGNPMWEEFGIPLLLDRTAVRGVLQMSSEYGRVVASPGGKDRELNLICWRALRALVDQNLQLRVFLTRHPGDKTTQAEYEAMLGMTDRFQFAPTTITSAMLVSAADALVEPSPTSLAMQAAMAVRIPVLTMMSQAGYDRMERVFGTRDWPLWKLDCGHRTSERELSWHLSDLLAVEGARGMVASQRRVFPDIPPVGTAVNRMLAALQRFRK